MDSCTSFWNFFRFFPSSSAKIVFFGHNFSTDWDINLKKVSVTSKSTIADIFSYIWGSVNHFIKCLPKSGQAGPKMPIFGTFFTFPAGGKLIVVFNIVEMYNSCRKTFWRIFATWDFRFDCTIYTLITYVCSCYYNTTPLHDNMSTGSFILISLLFGALLSA